MCRRCVALPPFLGLIVEHKANRLGQTVRGKYATMSRAIWMGFRIARQLPRKVSVIRGSFARLPFRAHITP